MKRGHHETDSNGRWQPRAKPSPKAACTTPDSNSIFCDDAYQHVVLLSWRPVARPDLESDSGDVDDARPFENLAFALFQILHTRETNLSSFVGVGVCRRPSCGDAPRLAPVVCLSCAVQDGNCHFAVDVFQIRLC